MKSNKTKRKLRRNKKTKKQYGGEQTPEERRKMNYLDTIVGSERDMEKVFNMESSVKTGQEKLQNLNNKLEDSKKILESALTFESDDYRWEYVSDPQKGITWAVDEDDWNVVKSRVDNPVKIIESATDINNLMDTIFEIFGVNEQSASQLKKEDEEARKKKEEKRRRKYLEETEAFEEARKKEARKKAEADAAATKIQAHFRGHQARASAKSDEESSDDDDGDSVSNESVWSDEVDNADNWYFDEDEDEDDDDDGDSESVVPKRIGGGDVVDDSSDGEKSQREELYSNISKYNEICLKYIIDAIFKKLLNYVLKAQKSETQRIYETIFSKFTFLAECLHHATLYDETIPEYKSDENGVNKPQNRYRSYESKDGKLMKNFLTRDSEVPMSMVYVINKLNPNLMDTSYIQMADRLKRFLNKVEVIIKRLIDVYDGLLECKNIIMAFDSIISSNDVSVPNIIDKLSDEAFNKNERLVVWTDNNLVYRKIKLQGVGARKNLFKVETGKDPFPSEYRIAVDFFKEYDLVHIKLIMHTIVKKLISYEFQSKEVILKTLNGFLKGSKIAKARNQTHIKKTEIAEWVVNTAINIVNYQEEINLAKSEEREIKEEEKEVHDLIQRQNQQTRKLQVQPYDSEETVDSKETVEGGKKNNTKKKKKKTNRKKKKTNRKKKKTNRKKKKTKRKKKKTKRKK